MQKTMTHLTQFTKDDTSVSWDHAEIAFSIGVMRLPSFRTMLFQDRADAIYSEFNTSEQRNNALTYRGGNK